jgi:hypothetical protein
LSGAGEKFPGALQAGEVPYTERLGPLCLADPEQNAYLASQRLLCSGG